MAQALAAVVLVGAALGLYEVMSLNRQSNVLRQTLQKQTQMIDGLRLTIKQRQAAAVPAELAMGQELKARRAELLQLDSTLAELQLGVFRPGEGHAARLALVAGSIPATAWVTLVKADARRLELSGFTFDPAALNGWIDQLAASPLLAGQRLAAVNVIKVVAPVESAQPVWSFSLVNAIAAPSAVASAPAAGARR